MLFKKDYGLYAPIDGVYLPLELVQDTTFSTGLMGPGFGIYPERNLVRSPFDGKITMVFPTKHAIGIRRKDGVDLLIHIGIETVNLKGSGFKTFVAKGDSVKKGETLIQFDQQKIIEQGLDSTIIVIVTNAKEYDITFKPSEGKIEYGVELADVRKK